MARPDTPENNAQIKDKMPDYMQDLANNSTEIAHIDRFYHSPNGRLLAHLIRSHLPPLVIPKDNHLDDRLTIGFGYPFMCLPSDLPMPVMIPSEMGALAHGVQGKVTSATIESHHWPLASDCANQIIICHGLEYCYDAEAALAEAHRVLTSAGSLLLLVANRASLWVRDESTPFGHGRPFSKAQITKLLRKTGFEISSVRRCVFLPPMAMRLPFKMAMMTDHIGHYGWGLFGGAMIIEASKLTYASPKQRVMPSKPVLSGLLRPAVENQTSRTLQTK